MLEPPRVGLPNLVGQSEVIARTRSAQAGAAEAVHAQVADALQQDSVRKAEQLSPTERVERTAKDREESREQGGQDGRQAGDEPDDDGEGDGHLLDVVA